MRNVKNSEHSDRRGTAADAKAKLLETYKAAQKAAEPARAAKQAERLATAEAREARRAERERVKLEEQNRIEAETAERENALATAAKAEAEARQLADKNRIARVLEDEAARKAERDRRYANRKSRKA